MEDTRSKRISETTYTSGELARRGGDAVAKNNQITPITPGDMFGLERHRNSLSGLEEDGKRAFSDAANKIVNYVQKDKAAMEQFSDADNAMELPFITSERLSGKLTLITERNGTATISFTTGEARANRRPAGFHMAQGADGRVSVIHADIESERIWTPSTNGYEQAITAVNSYLGVYFEALESIKTDEALRKKIGENANTLYGMREAVGTKTTTVFGKEIKSKRSDRSAKKILGLIAGDDKKRR